MIKFSGKRNNNYTNDVAIMDLSNNEYAWVGSYTPPLSGTSNTTQPNSAKSVDSGVIVGSVLGAVSLISILSNFYLWFRYRYRQKGSSPSALIDENLAERVT